MHSSLVKICGISDCETLAQTIAAGADFVGFVHFEKSPRHVDISTLVSLIQQTSDPAQSVIVLVNPTDALLDEIFAGATPDYVQLHGDESPERAQQIKQKYGVKIIKAIGVSSANDIQFADHFLDATDIILLDAKPPKNSANVGGLGISFDWKLLDSSFLRLEYSWMLSGGLSNNNIAEALSITHAPMVDVSSGVETPTGSGKKDIQKIRDFIHQVKQTS